MLKFGLPCDLLWRTMLRAFLVETNVDRGSDLILFFGEISFDPALLP